MISQLEIALIKTYRALSHPIYNTLDRFNINPIKCKYTPTCSEYAIEAISKYGFIKGTIMGAKRIHRCAPGYPGGHDPVK